MPGIAGIISGQPDEKNVGHLKDMIRCMVHEPFYTSGTYINPYLGVYAGWTCLKGSFADCMPVFNETRDLVLIFSGENFIDNDRIHYLKRKGHAFENSDASYLIHLYEEEGDRFYKLLNGFFRGMIVDLRNREIVVFTDRYGMGRVYYHDEGDQFLFSTEAKSLLSIRPELREISPKSLGEYFTCGCVLQDRTLFSNVFVLPGGSAWSFQNGKELKKDSYFEPDTLENQPVLEKETFYEGLREALHDVIPRYFRPDGRIAMSLTGGLDTRIVLAYGNNRPGELPCYTFGSVYRDSFDVCRAREIAKMFNQQHIVLPVGKEFLSDFPAYAERTIYISDGCLDIIGSPELYINQIAREIAPIRMTGNYGSEVLRNVRTFKAVSPLEKMFHPDFLRDIDDAFENFRSIGREHELTFTLFRQTPWYGYGRLAMEQSQLTVRTPFLDNDLVALAYRAPPGIAGTDEFALRLIADGNPALRRIRTDRGIGGNSNYLSSIFSRSYHEFLFKSEYYYNYGMPQWLAKIDYAFRPLQLERWFLGRHKFHHFRVWLRDELSEFVREILLDKRTTSRPFLNKDFLEEMVNSHIRGHGNYTVEINKILSAEMIHRLFIERK